MGAGLVAFVCHEIAGSLRGAEGDYQPIELDTVMMKGTQATGWSGGRHARCPPAPGDDAQRMIVHGRRARGSRREDDVGEAEQGVDLVGLLGLLPFMLTE
jgi:hypothetical protein